MSLPGPGKASLELHPSHTFFSMTSLAPFPPDQKANLDRIAGSVSHSAWLSIVFVCLTLAGAIWLLLRVRRAVRQRTSLKLLVNTIAFMTAVFFLTLSYYATDTLLVPAAMVQAFY